MWAVTVADGRKCPWAEGGHDGDEGVERCVCIYIWHGWRSQAKIFLICTYLLMNSSCRSTAMSTAQAALQCANGRQSMFGLPVLCKDEKFQGTHPKLQKREETKSGNMFQGSTTQDWECARLLQAEEDEILRGIDESMAGDLQYARLLQEEEWAAAAQHAANKKDGKSKQRDEHAEVLVLESEVTREGICRPCRENCDADVCSEDCDEDVCPDLHEMFVYYDAIYFG